MSPSVLRIRRQLLFVGIVLAVCLSLGLLFAPTSSFAGDLSITREVFVEKGDIPDPQVIVRTRDNEFVMAGTHGIYEAWATRVDAQGNVKWRYVLPVPRDSSHGNGLNYQSVAVMPDDSVFLCGQKYRVNENGYDALLTHIDKAGKVLSEETLSPRDEGLPPLATFNDCMPWQDGLVVVGHTFRYANTPVSSTPSHAPPRKLKPLYWVAALDSGGKVKWEKLFPIVDGLAGSTGSAMALFHQPIGDGGFLISGGYTSGFGTEIIHFGPKGDVVAKKFFPKDYLTPVQPVDDKDVTLQLASAVTERFTVITLDKDLQEVKRVSEPHERGGVDVAYRLPDQSLVLFGSHFLRQTFEEARVMKLSPSLQDEQDLYFEPRFGAYWIKAAVPSDAVGDFATARLVQIPSTHDETLEEAKRDFLGVGLTTVHVDYNKKQ